MNKQKIVIARPPLWDEINAKFRVEGQPVIFSWGDTIYNPQNIQVTPALQAHEFVHGLRQIGNAKEWWQRYLDDVKFRLDEEIRAHLGEYEWYLRYSNRKTRRTAHAAIAQRLAGDLYGRLISKKQAMTILGKLKYESQ